MNLGVFFFSYFISVHLQLNDKTIKILFVLMYIATTYHFYETRDMIAYIYDGRNRTMNVAYDFVILLPYLFLFKNRLLPLVFLLPTIFFITYSCKRGAILILVVASIFIIYNLYLKNSKRHLFTNIVIIIIILLGSKYVVNSVFQSNSLLQYKLDLAMEGDANGRNTIFEIIWDYWFNCNDLKHYIFGFVLLLD